MDLLQSSIVITCQRAVLMRPGALLLQLFAEAEALQLTSHTFN